MYNKHTTNRCNSCTAGLSPMSLLPIHTRQPDAVLDHVNSRPTPNLQHNCTHIAPSCNISSPQPPVIEQVEGPMLLAPPWICDHDHPPRLYSLPNLNETATRTNCLYIRVHQRSRVTIVGQDYLRKILNIPPRSVQNTEVLFGYTFILYFYADKYYKDSLWLSLFFFIAVSLSLWCAFQPFPLVL